MCARAAASIVAATEAGERRLSVSVVVPLLPTVRAEDIDPWPGGLKQQFDTVEALTKDILQRVVTGRGGAVKGDARTQVINAEDACALVIQEGDKSEEDIAAVIFPSPDQLQDLQRVEAMVGSSRPLITINPQWRRAEGFGFFRKGEGQKVVDRYTVGFAFEEFSCRGESVKLTCDRDGKTGGAACWRSFCVVGEDPMRREVADAAPPLALHDEPLPDRPSYSRTPRGCGR